MAKANNQYVYTRFIYYVNKAQKKGEVKKY
jgi:hypothetical protein